MTSSPHFPLKAVSWKLGIRTYTYEFLSRGMHFSLWRWTSQTDIFSTYHQTKALSFTLIGLNETSHGSQGMPQMEELSFCPWLNRIIVWGGRMRWFGLACLGGGEVLPQQHGSHPRQEGRHQQHLLRLTHLFLCCWVVTLLMATDSCSIT